MPFDTTSWTLIEHAQGDDSQAEEALNHLCKRYWTPLYGFARSRGYDSEQAAELTQGFFLTLLEKDLVQRADAQKGRFRTFLLTLFTRYIGSEHRRARAQKRGVKFEHFSLDAEHGERLYAQLPDTVLTPEQAFNRQWAIQLISAALNDLEADYKAAGKQRLYAELRQAIVEPDSLDSYQQIAERLTMSTGAVKVAVHRLRQRFREKLKERVKETVADPEDLDDELRYLLDVLR